MDSSSPPEAVAERVLAARAERLARVEEVVASGRPVAHTCFSRGGARFAVPAAALRRVIAVDRICELPGSTAVVPGVVVYDGDLLSAHDLHAWFRRPDDVEAPTWGLVVDVEGGRLVLLADEIDDVQTLDLDQLTPPPIGLRESGALLVGVHESDVLVLCPDALFRQPGFAFAVRAER